MRFRIPALDDEACPKCHEANHGAAVIVWSVADERGFHHECDSCAHAWWPDVDRDVPPRAVRV